MKSVNGTGMKRAALISDLSCFGKCSLSVAMPIGSSAGIEAVPLPTAVLSTHTSEFPDYVLRDMTQEMAAFMTHWKALDIRFDAVCTGFFCSPEQILLAQQFLRDFAPPGTLVLVDPIMGDSGELYGSFTPEIVEAMRALIEKADIITPNRTEAALLAGLPYDTPDEALVEALTCENVILTSVRHGAQAGYFARLDGQTLRVDTPVVGGSFYGAGDVFTASLLSALLTGCDKADALCRAADFTIRAIRDTAARRPAHWYGLAFEDELKGGAL